MFGPRCAPVGRSLHPPSSFKFKSEYFESFRRIAITRLRFHGFKRLFPLDKDSAILREKGQHFFRGAQFAESFTVFAQDARHGFLARCVHRAHWWPSFGGFARTTNDRKCAPSAREIARMMADGANSRFSMHQGCARASRAPIVLPVPTLWYSLLA